MNPEELVGRSALLRCPVGAKDSATLWPQVVIKKTRVLWGRVDCLVSPSAGEGEAWVSEDRLRMVES